MNNAIEKSQSTGLIRIGEVLADLQNRGFSYLFKLKDESICCKDYNITFEEFDILEAHSIDAASEEAYFVLYAIKCDKYNIKGVIVNQFETYSNGFSDICINKILNNKEIRLNIIAG